MNAAQYKIHKANHQGSALHREPQALTWVGCGAEASDHGSLQFIRCTLAMLGISIQTQPYLKLMLIHENAAPRKPPFTSSHTSCCWGHYNPSQAPAESSFDPLPLKAPGSGRTQDCLGDRHCFGHSLAPSRAVTCTP